MKNLDELREIMLTERLTTPPHKREYYGDWTEVVVAIGPSGFAYVTMPREDYEKLLELTEAPAEKLQPGEHDPRD